MWIYSLNKVFFQKYLVLGLVLLCFSGTIAAQQRDTIHAKAHPRKTRPLKDLHLDAQQTSQIKQINKESKQSLDSLKSDTTLSADLRRERQKQLVISRREKIKAILTPEQLIKYDEAMKENIASKKKRKQ